MTTQHIHFIKTGGTIEFIDPAYDGINKKLLKIDSTIESYVNNLIKPHFTISSESIVEKDSRDITDADREKLLTTIQSSAHQNIIITHGTFTMGETATFLQGHDFGDKKVIITGSMIPILGFAGSDGGFNLGFAIGKFSSLEPGVYIGMNGGIFTADEVSKNIEQFRFE